MHRVHDADRIRRKTVNVNDIRVRGLDCTNDWREVELIWGKTAVVNDIEIIFLRPVARADCRGLWKFRIGDGNGDRLRFRIHLHSDIEEALRKGDVSVGPKRKKATDYSGHRN